MLYIKKIIIKKDKYEEKLIEINIQYIQKEIYIEKNIYKKKHI